MSVQGLFWQKALECFYKLLAPRLSSHIGDSLRLAVVGLITVGLNIGLNNC